MVVSKAFGAFFAQAAPNHHFSSINTIGIQIAVFW
jgi:hypothetical protein